MKEKWKDIPGFEGYYQASTSGKVRRDGRILKPKTKQNGYNGLHLSVNGVSFHKTAHRLVAETFIPNPSNLPDINHKNGIKTDNRVENLEWISKSANTLHAYRMKLMKAHPKLGEECHFSKLNEKSVIEIRKTYSSVIKDLSRKFKISKSAIREIVNNKSWKSV